MSHPKEITGIEYPVMSNHLMHSADECDNYRTFYPAPFSHRRYIANRIRKVIFRYRTSYPLLSSESLAKGADVSILDDFSLHKLHKSQVEKARTFFVKSDLLHDFISTFSYCVNSGSILFTGHSDRNFDSTTKVPDAFELWFCQNSAISDNKRVFTLPIGLENVSLGRFSPRLLRGVGNNQIKIVDRVLVPPMSPTNLIRKETVLKCSNNDMFILEKQMRLEADYFRLTSQYQFVLCLEGNGFDSHRVWETLYQGSFPVLLQTKWSDSLAYLGLPILIVQNIESINSQILKSFMDNNKTFFPSNHQVLYVPFWKKLAKLNIDNAVKQLHNI